MLQFDFSNFPNLSTDRLVLRQTTLEDDGDILRLRSDERVLQFIDISPTNSLEDARKHIEIVNDNILRNESLYWAILLKGKPSLIGTICLWNMKAEIGEAEIGYMLHPDFQGKGLMQEVLKKVISHGFEVVKLNTIVALVNPANLPSIKLLEKEGFVYEGISEDMAKYFLKNPQLSDVIHDTDKRSDVSIQH